MNVRKHLEKVLSFLTFAACIPAFAAPLFIGYYPDWGKWRKPAYSVDKVPYDKLTHVLWSFITPNTDGTLHGDAADDPTALDSMVTLAHAAGTKVILSLGGGGQSANFTPVAKDNSLRQKFIENLVRYVKDHNLDGLDMDWEWDYSPVPDQDTIAYNKLLTELREALPKNKSLSAALPCSRYYGKYFTPEVLVKNLDWFGFMTYDMTGSWDEKAMFDSPLYPHEGYTTWSWKQTLDYWSERGVPTSKMVFGIPTFGFEFEGATGPGTKFTKDKVTTLGYAKIVANTDWQFYFDSVSVEPYAISANSYTTFEDPHSAAEKARWVKQNNFAGIMIWEVSYDYIEGVGQPILDSIALVLREQTTALPRKNLLERKIGNDKFHATRDANKIADIKGRKTTNKANYGVYFSTFKR